MSAPFNNLEPVPRDPRKLRRTAWILVAIMIFGGIFVLKAYDRWTAEKSQDVRPAFDGGRLTGEKDLPLIRQDGTKSGLIDLSGKISVIHTISVTQPETAALTTEVMQRLARHYSGNADCVLISLVLDPGPAETAKATLETAATKIGATLPQWWIATTEPAIIHKYVKKEFRANLFPHQDAEQKWVYDTSITLVDRNRHIRRAVVPQKQGGPPFVATFDFDQAAKWDAKGVKTGTDRSNVQELEALLIKTIDELLAEPVKKS